MGLGPPVFKAKKISSLSFNSYLVGGKEFYFQLSASDGDGSNSWRCKSHLMKCLNILKWAVLYSVSAQPCWVCSQKSSRV